jgi:hypothetical protein
MKTWSAKIFGAGAMATFNAWERGRIPKAVFGLSVLIILGLCLPFMGWGDEASYTIENKCDKEVDGTVRLNYLIAGGKQGSDVPYDFSLTKGHQTKYSGVASLKLCPNKIQASYGKKGSQTALPILWCTGTVDECCADSTATYKMKGGECTPTSNKSYWRVTQ